MTFPVKGLEKFFLKYNPSLLIRVFESTISSAKTENEIPKNKKKTADLANIGTELL